MVYIDVIKIVMKQMLYKNIEVFKLRVIIYADRWARDWGIPSTEKLVIGGDFNDYICRSREGWHCS